MASVRAGVSPSVRPYATSAGESSSSSARSSAISPVSTSSRSFDSMLWPDSAQLPYAAGTHELRAPRPARSGSRRPRACRRGSRTATCPSSSSSAAKSVSRSAISALLGLASGTAHLAVWAAVCTGYPSTMPRAIWSGSIAFGLVNAPVKMYSAIDEHKLELHLVHEKDGSPIGYDKVCKKEGKKVPADEIVKAYEVSRRKAGLPDGRGLPGGRGGVATAPSRSSTSSRATRSTRSSSTARTTSARPTAPRRSTRCS